MSRVNPFVDLFLGRFGRLQRGGAAVHPSGSTERGGALSAVAESTRGHLQSRNVVGVHDQAQERAINTGVRHGSHSVHVNCQFRVHTHKRTPSKSRQPSSVPESQTSRAQLKAGISEDTSQRFSSTTFESSVILAYRFPIH